MSHYTVLAAVELPEPDVEYLSQNRLALQVEGQLDDLLAPYEEGTNNPDYLEFVDMEESARLEYLTQTMLCVKMPDGRILPAYSGVFSNLYEIYDGKVYKRRCGPLHHRKRTKKAKRIKLVDYPLRKLFPTLKVYVEDFCGYQYSEEEGAYGYYHNPDAKWDWYEIGGRWPYRFLVKSDCPSALPGSRSFLLNDQYIRLAPDGYRWVSIARKSDIQWDLMKRLALKETFSAYKNYKHWFREGLLPADTMPFLRITEAGIQDWGTLVYRKDDTLEKYLHRAGLSREDRYAFDTYALLDSAGWKGSGDMGWSGIISNSMEEREWQDEIQAFLADLDDTVFLVSVDCHI